jgi:hypothetical protein
MSVLEELQEAWDNYKKVDKSDKNEMAGAESDLAAAQSQARAEIEKLEKEQEGAPYSDQKGLDDEIGKLQDLLDETESTGGRRRRKSRKARKTRRGGRKSRKSRKSRK